MYSSRGPIQVPKLFSMEAHRSCVGRAAAERGSRVLHAAWAHSVRHARCAWVRAVMAGWLHGILVSMC